MKSLATAVLLLSLTTSSKCSAWVFAPHQRSVTALTPRSRAVVLHSAQHQHQQHPDFSASSRRDCLRTFAAGSAGAALLVVAGPAANAEESMFAPKFVQEYSDFVEAPSGWRYRDVKDGGSGPKAERGDRVVFDWSGYTIGYFGRPFEAKGGPAGGAFDKDIDFFRTVIGSGTVVRGLEEALQGMTPGTVRQVVIPFQGDLSYPPDDLTHDRVGPKPTTFSGQRALNFVLENPRLDRTLLFNVKVIRIDKANGKGGFVRG